MQREQLYTNIPQVFLGAGNPYAGVTMDTWYYSEWAASNHGATLGKMALGEGPLIPAQGVVTFVARQVVAFREAFTGIFRPTRVTVGYKPRLTGVVHHPLAVPVPESQEDVQAIQTALEQFPYEGITSLSIAFEMRAKVRDEHGGPSHIWLPYAGSAQYHAHYTAGSVSNLPQSVAVTYLLTPSAQQGVAPWTVNLECSFLSLFRDTNAEVLDRVRDRWRRWLEAHPMGTEPRDEDDESKGTNDENDEWEDYVVTLAEPPRGTPPDNRDLSERNAPVLRAGVGRWEESLASPFEWATAL